MRAPGLVSNLVLCLALGLGAPSCAAAPGEASALELRDPLGLLRCDAGETSGCVPAGQLRLYVLPAGAGAYECSAGGGVMPDIPDSPADAITDISIDIAASARYEIDVPIGDWVVLVRGRGVDAVSGIPNQVVANGCTSVGGLLGGETRGITVTVLPVTGMGVCGDTILSPDEQCEPPGTASCDVTCRTLPFAVNVASVTGRQDNVHLASSPGHRVLATFDNASDPSIRVFTPDGTAVASPPALASDETLTNLQSMQTRMALPGTQLGAVPAVATSGGMAIALVDFVAPATPDVRIAFLTENRIFTSDAVLAHAATTGTQDNPALAFAGTGALLLAFEDDQSATGLTLALYATPPAAPTDPVVGTPVSISAAGASSPAVAGTSSGFVVAYAAAGGVFFQRFAADGTPMDAAGVNVLAAPTGTQDQPTVAAMPGGSFLVAWRDGSTIRARAFDNAGMPAGADFALSTTAAGSVGSPVAAAASGRFAVAWEADGAVRARVVTETGADTLNRESPPTTGDFVVAPAGTGPAVTAVGTGTTAAWFFGWMQPTDGSGEILGRLYPR